MIHGQGSEKSGDALRFRRSLTLYPRIALNLVPYVPKLSFRKAEQLLQNGGVPA